MFNILVCDDDKEIVDAIDIYLSQEGYHILKAYDGLQAIEIMKKEEVHLILLDIMMKGLSGLDVCRKIRSRVSCPILFLSAKDSVKDIVAGLDLGADDYLAKPFEPRELLARIRTVLRRAGAPGGSGTSTARALRFAGWLLDRAARKLVAPDGVVVHLSGAELRLLRVFLEHPQQVLSRDELLERTQGRDATAFDRSIDVQVSRLRVRLRDNGREARIIKTVRGDGYVLAADVFPASLPEYGGEAH